MRVTAAILLLFFFLTSSVLATTPGSQWLQVANNPGSYYSNAGGLFNMVTNLTIVAGFDSRTSTASNTTWTTQDGVSFTVLNASPGFPARYGFAYAYYDNKAWLMGGYDGTRYLNDTWYSSDGKVWILANLSSGWLAKCFSSAGVLNGRLYLLGGTDGVHTLSQTEFWFLDTTNETKGLWTRVTPNVGGTFYSGSQMVQLNNKLWLDDFNTLYGIDATGAYIGGGAAVGNCIAATNGNLVVACGGGTTVYTSTDGSTVITANTTANIPAQVSLGMVNWTPSAGTVPWHGTDGIYIVYMKYTAGGINTFVTLPPPVASATPVSASGTAPLAVGWNDATTGYSTDWVWDFRDGYFSYVENASHVFTSSGTYGVLFTPSSPFGSSTFTSTVSVSTSQSSVQYYTQRQVQMRAVDAAGVPLVGATIAANYTASSLPSTSTQWLISAFGISPTVALEMTNSSLAMSGVTGTDGSVTFVMFPSITYRILVTNATLGLSNTVYISPTDTAYNIYCPLSSQRAQNQTYMTLSNTTLYVTEPDPNHVTFHLLYFDPSGLTTNLKYNVTCWTNQTPMYYVDLGNPGTAVVTDDSYTVPNVKGQEWRFFYNATRSVPL